MSTSVAIVETGPALSFDRLLAEVSAEEQAAYRVLAQRRRAKQYLASRWLLRRHLAEELGHAPDKFEIAYPADAAPRLVDMSVHLGLSHSDTLCLSVVSTNAAVGCDVERVRRRRHTPAEIAALYFAPKEAQALAAQDGDAQLADFYRLWTLKEAALKACERGISHGLRSVVFEPGLAYRCTRAPNAGAWTFGARDWISTSGRFALAVAVQHVSASFTAWQFDQRPNGTTRRELPGAWDIFATNSPQMS